MADRFSVSEKLDAVNAGEAYLFFIENGPP
jgi:hypothetical protein